MSTKLKFIIAFLFSIQIGIVVWSFHEKAQEKAAFRELFLEYLDEPSAVDSMDLSSLGIDKLIGEMSDFVDLEYLDLSENEFTEIPKILFELPNLKVLKMSKNKLKKANLSNFQNLETLDLSYNELSSLDLEQSNVFSNLKVLNLSHNQFSTFPDIPNTAKNTLLELDLRINKLTINQDFFDDFNELEVLYLGNINILGSSYNNSELKILEKRDVNFLNSFSLQCLNLQSFSTNLDILERNHW
jgi:Leucine-rich repeat (LRR) protein